MFELYVCYAVWPDLAKFRHSWVKFASFGLCFESSFWIWANVSTFWHCFAIGQILIMAYCQELKTYSSYLIHRGFLESARRAGPTAIFLPIEFVQSAVDHTNFLWELPNKSADCTKRMPIKLVYMSKHEKICECKII